MPTLTLKPTHKAVTAYYDSLAKFARLGIKYETAVRSAFHKLLEHSACQFDWKLVPEYAIKRKGQADAKADGALLDNYGLNHRCSSRRKEAQISCRVQIQPLVDSGRLVQFSRKASPNPR